MILDIKMRKTKFYSVGRGLVPAAQNHVAFFPHFGEFEIPGDGGSKPPPYTTAESLS